MYSLVFLTHSHQIVGPTGFHGQFAEWNIESMTLEAVRSLPSRLLSSNEIFFFYVISIASSHIFRLKQPNHQRHEEAYDENYHINSDGLPKGTE